MWPQLAPLLEGREVLAWNAGFDFDLDPFLGAAHCRLICNQTGTGNRGKVRSYAGSSVHADREADFQSWVKDRTVGIAAWLNIHCKVH